MLKVSYEALNMAVADLQRSAGNIEEKLDELARRIAAQQDQWTGEASNAFNTARLEWESAMRDMRTVLQDIATTVRSSNENYQGSERANLQRFQGGR